ncbi:hypothetical protein BK022_15690 [Methylorubrum extorquens]|uniref:Peptidase S8/S53 domain-containing protein n=1 Tax=Methylorubrum extorquens TaxID=408 RepID=A0A1S1P3W1_METEX|nr:hypothetical protein BK022_15690 [Methylorubrum extorquens]
MASFRPIPIQLVEHFLLGHAGLGELQRFTQDGGIVADVWLSFAQNLGQPRVILFTPVDGIPAIEAATAVHNALSRYREYRPTEDDPLRSKIGANRKWTNVSPLDSFVTATVYFDELIRVILPMTHWWASKNLEMLRDERQAAAGLRFNLESYISDRLGRARATPRPAPQIVREFLEGSRSSNTKVREATSIVALIGLFAAAGSDARILPEPGPSLHLDKEGPAAWSARHAERIAREAVRELRRSISPTLLPPKIAISANPHATGSAVVQRIFLDRETHLAETEALCTVKADAANRVFDISCRSMTWAIVDSGIAAAHPAFDEYQKGPDGIERRMPGRRRIRATFDLTLIHRIRNLDLTVDDEMARDIIIEDIINDLRRLPGRRDSNFEQGARENLLLIAAQLKRRLLPDWALIEPLIRVLEDDGAGLSSDHGTHVAGILAADWREPGVPGLLEGAEQIVLRGICPDISLYDLRVMHPTNVKNTEFAIIAALEFVRHLNGRAAGPPLIHGVNISLSIPHEVRNYGCGATPVCVACDDLVQSGVVVVAAAGNRGWNERELGFGNFVFCSITDPGNAQRVITVGATHRTKPHTYGVSYFSSRGPTGDGRAKPDLVAPGEKIRGPVRGGADDELDGTSMAAPFVSGAAAMIMARNRELMRNPQRIKEILCASATDLGRERYFQGSGLVDVLRALQSI